MCTRHTNDNLQFEDEFLKELDQNVFPNGTRFFTFYPQVYNFNHAEVREPKNPFNYNVLPDVEDPAIFMLQYVIVGERQLLVFYDSGCMGAAINEYAASVLDTECVRPGPTLMSVAGAATIELETGDEQFTLLMSDRKSMATITALRMPEITTPFPTWDLEEAWNDVLKAYSSSCPTGPSLPPAPRRIGGAPVDIMLGIRYLIHYPELLFSLPCGLGVYKSKFHAPNGEITVLGGPHRAWRMAETRSNIMGLRSFLTAEARAYFFETSTISHLYNQANTIEEDSDEFDMFEIGESFEVKSECSYIHCSNHSGEDGWIASTSWNKCIPTSIHPSNPMKLSEVADLGIDIQYRCMRCRNCNECRKGESLERISLKEEAEQYLIEESVTYNTTLGHIEAVLPFIKSPEDCLTNNFHRAMKILESQIRLAEKSEQTRLDILSSHKRLHEKGHVIPLEELDPDTQELVQDGPGYHIPWRTVYKEGSLSTPVRMVFDASSLTPGGECLNNLLAKGENNLCKILHILICFRIRPFAFTADVSMAYNGVKLHPKHYKYQKYLWKEDLKADNPVKVMVVKTLIYGVRSAGNQLNAGFKKLGDHCMNEFPNHTEGAKVLLSSIYVDDILKSCSSEEEMKENADSLVFILKQAGMGVKSVTYSGLPPSEMVSADLTHVGLVGLTWDSQDDVIGIDIKPLFFGKAKRGKVPELVTGDMKTALSKVFTRRVITGKVAGIFDPLGLVTPITSNLKLDLRTLSIQGLNWDDQIPDKYLDTWVRNLDKIQATKEIRFRRTVIPINAASTCISIITSSDASENIAVACVHTRVPLQGGGYHVQLLTAKSRLVSTNTIPKAELKGAVMGASLSFVVRSNLGALLDSSLYVTDSSIVLFWINQDQRPLQTGVRNGVVEIRRLTDPGRWYHVDTELNVADIGTRPCEVQDIGSESRWQGGADWMKLEEAHMPIRSIVNITLNGEQRRLAAQGLKAPDLHGITLYSLRTKVADRYGYSQYLLDPNKYCWERVTRVMGYVLRFVRYTRPSFSPDWKPPVHPYGAGELLEGVPVDPRQLQDEDLLWAQNYYFKIGTEEVKQFCSKKEYKDVSIEKGGILYYSSRILDGQTIEDPEGTMLDLKPLSFVRPILDRWSPISYSIMLYAHGVMSKHRNVSCSLRESRGVAYVLHGRELAIEIYEGCVSCRRFKARLLEAEMGKTHENRLTIAPAFYLVQVDLFGPFQAICEHNHRSTVKCYGVIFKDPSTSAIAIFMMQNYSTSAFLQAYTRFSSRYGHPGKIFIDAGSQLIKACKDGEFAIVDVAAELSTAYQVGMDYQTCPVGGHNAHGAVERSIRDIRALLDRVFSGLKLDLVSYETCFAWISNELNCFPICIGSKTSNLDHVDLITPSRLLLGRNNRRSLGGYVKLDTPSRLMDQMDKVYKSWWAVWKNEKILDYIPQSTKWKKTSAQPAVGDVVIFLKSESDVGFGDPVWKMGRVEEVQYSNDGVIRSVKVLYKNHNERVFRSTTRSVRKIAILHHEGELELVEQLNHAAKDAGILYFLRNPE